MFEPFMYNVSRFEEIAERLEAKKAPKDLLELRTEAADAIRQLVADLEIQVEKHRRDIKLCDIKVENLEITNSRLERVIVDQACQLLDFHTIDGLASEKRDRIWTDYEKKVDAIYDKNETRRNQVLKS